MPPSGAVEASPLGASPFEASSEPVSSTLTRHLLTARYSSWEAADLILRNHQPDSL